MMNGIKEIHKNGDIWYILDGHPHREDGPAVIWQDGSQFWYVYGKCHRKDGPDVVYKDNEFALTERAIQWWYHGEYLSCKTQQEFEQLMRLKAFL